MALPLYCRKIKIVNSELLKIDNGPVLLAANHPNSFLDAILLCTLFKKPIYSLARGDAFKNKLAAKFLRRFYMFPVYRVSEGVENLEENYKTFDECKKIFRQNGQVLIFSEGRCINEWHLRPLKKGTARLALDSWENGIDLKVIPVGINYSSFYKFGKNIHLYLGDIISKKDFQTYDLSGNNINDFNQKLREQLNEYVYEINENDKAALAKKFFVKQPLLKRILIFFPALMGLLIHAPLYYLIKGLQFKLIKEPGHFDAAMIAFSFLLYPLFVIIGVLLLYLATGSLFSLIALIVIPFTAWAYIQLKAQI